MSLNVIQPNCRMQFTAEDVEFVVSVLGKHLGSAECLAKLLADEETRDQILDDETLFRAVLEQRGCLRVSMHFYFYILVRHAFKRSGLDDRPVADYVAEVLAEFSRSERSRCVVPGKPEPLDYFCDLLAALQMADDHTTFYIRAHIGNQSLFLAGVFRDRICYRAERKGFPDLKYYEELGRTNFRVASDHRLARKYELAPVFNILAERFQATRLALNDLTDRLLSLGDPDYPLNRLPGLPDNAG